MPYIQIQGRRLEFEYTRAGPAAPVMVLLHEGLGSVSMWRDFPARLVRTTGCSALVYSRYGHGASDAVAEPRRADFMHEEATLALPELLDALGIGRPLLLGHSDGGSIALIHAAAGGRAVAGLIVMAPHVMVEELTLESIRKAKEAFETTDLESRFARYHAHPGATFRAWNDIWLAPEFRDWSIVECLPRIPCPVLAIQGEDDEYGTMRQIELIAESAPDVRLLKLGNCGHSPHRDRPEAVLAAVADFVARLPS